MEQKPIESADVAPDEQPMVSDNDFRTLLSQTIQAQGLLKQGYGVREVSTMLNIPYGLVADLKSEIGIKSTTKPVLDKARKQKRKAQKLARKKNRR